MPRNYETIDLSEFRNRSILIVDDNNSVHRDYQAVLCPNPNEGEENELEKLESFLLDESEPAPQIVRNFELQFASQGEEAYELIKKHLSKGIRHPLAFVDMRMPPGWNGLETIRKIMQLDPEMKFTIVTAYSDESEASLRSEIGEQNLVKIIYKPFDPREIYQLAYEVVADWNTNQAELARAKNPAPRTAAAKS